MNAAKEILLKGARETVIFELISQIESELKSQKSLGPSLQTSTEASFCNNRQSNILIFVLGNLKSLRLSQAFHKILNENKVKRIKEHVINLASEVCLAMKAKQLKCTILCLTKSRIHHAFVKIQYMSSIKENTHVSSFRKSMRNVIDYRKNERHINDGSEKLLIILKKHKFDKANYAFEKIKQSWETRMVIEEGIDILISTLSPKINNKLLKLGFENIKNSTLLSSVQVKNFKASVAFISKLFNKRLENSFRHIKSALATQELVDEIEIMNRIQAVKMMNNTLRNYSKSIMVKTFFELKLFGCNAKSFMRQTVNHNIISPNKAILVSKYLSLSLRHILKKWKTCSKHKARFSKKISALLHLIIKGKQIVFFKSLESASKQVSDNSKATCVFYTLREILSKNNHDSKTLAFKSIQNSPPIISGSMTIEIQSDFKLKAKILTFALLSVLRRQTLDSLKSILEPIHQSNFKLRLPNNLNITSLISLNEGQYTATHIIYKLSKLPEEYSSKLKK